MSHKKEKYMKAYERLLNYVAVDTPSDPVSGKAPSSDCQFALAKMLVEELKKIIQKKRGA